jgi:hypothetical protein
VAKPAPSPCGPLTGVNEPAAACTGMLVAEVAGLRTLNARLTWQHFAQLMVIAVVDGGRRGHGPGWVVWWGGSPGVGCQVAEG